MLPFELTRFLTFATIGLFNAILDTSIWKMLVNFFQKNPILTKSFHKFSFNEYSVSHSISFVISAISSYILNKNLTFGDSKQSDSWQIVRFFTVAGFSWILTTLFLNFLTETDSILKISKPKFITKHWPLFAKLLTIGVSMITNFVGYRLFVF